MSRPTPSYSISISLLLIASLIYQLPLVAAARFVPSVPASESSGKAEEAAILLPTSTAASAAKAAPAAQNITTLSSAALSATNSNATAPNPLGVLVPSITATLADDISLG